jgi:hypothetical protein
VFNQVKDVKKAKFQLGVADPKLGSAIQESTQVQQQQARQTGSSRRQTGSSRSSNMQRGGDSREPAVAGQWACMLQCSCSSEELCFPGWRVC